jgi:hypothetical protein
MRLAAWNDLSDGGDTRRGHARPRQGEDPWPEGASPRSGSAAGVAETSRRAAASRRLLRLPARTDPPRLGRCGKLATPVIRPTRGWRGRALTCSDVRAAHGVHPT